MSGFSSPGVDREAHEAGLDRPRRDLSRDRSRADGLAVHLDGVGEVTASERCHLAWNAEAARLAGLPGAAERLEHELSSGMLADYAEFAAREAERHIAKHHRRRPKLPGEL